MTKFCTHCGKPTEEGEEYCGFCGQCLTQKGPEASPSNSVTVNKTNDLAIAGIIISIVLSAIIGIVLCIISLNQIKKTGEKGKEVAIAGIVIGVIKIVITIFWFIFVLFMAVTDSGTYYEEYDYSSNNAIVEVMYY